MNSLIQYLSSILCVGLLLGISACSHQPRWQAQYEQISESLVTEYDTLAENMTNAPYEYRFSFSLQPIIYDEPAFYYDAANQGEAVSNLSIPPEMLLPAAQVPQSRQAAAQQYFVLHASYQGDLAQLSATDLAELDAQINAIRELPNLHIHVVGHSDPTPINPSQQLKYPDNQALSVARARAVAEYLQNQLNLPAAAVSYAGMADMQPAYDNTTPEGRALNRRVEIFAEGTQTTEIIVEPVEVVAMPTDYEPWWRPVLIESFGERSDGVQTTLADVFLRTIQYSNQIKVFSDLPLIRQTSIQEAEGRFDPHVFVEGMYSDTDEPIGSTLQTGNEQRRFEEHEWRVEAGVRQPLITGGEVELAQRIGGLDNNSRFLVPHDQAHGRLALTFRQPLLNRAGITYNESTIEVAKTDYAISQDEFLRQVQAHLMEIARAYWGLYMERAMLLQKKKLLADTQAVYEELRARLGIDTLGNHLVLARAALEARKADSIRHEQAVRNAEAKLLALMNDPNLSGNRQLELIPISVPQLLPHEVNLTHVAQTALRERPEIKQAFKQLKAGLIRTQMARKELLPILDFMVEASLDGLEGDYEYGDAVDNQFNEGGPSYRLGLLLDVPLGNNVAEARHRRRQLEARQLINQLRTTIDTVLLEVQVSVREIETAYRELNSEYHALMASASNLYTLQERRGLDNEREGQSNYLQRLLNAQDDLVQHEQAFLNSYIAYNIAHFNLERSKGTLLAVQNIEIIEGQEDAFDGTSLPVLKLQQRVK